MKKRAEEIYTSYKKSLSEDYSLSSLAPCLEKTSRFKGRKEVGDKLPLMTEIASKSEVWGMVLAVPALASLLYLVLPLDAIFDFIPFLALLMTPLFYLLLSARSKKQSAPTLKVTWT